MRIILASKSPRRIRMMKERGYEPEIIPADIDETLPFNMKPDTAVMYLAFQKAQHVAKQIMQCLTEEGFADEGSADEAYAKALEPVVIIAADTVVVYEGEIIGKPLDEEDAFRILSQLRNHSHQVMTGVCLLKVDPAESITLKECLCDKTDVFFSDYSDEELRAYVRTNEPYDKAGGYAIQETFGKYIDHIEGDYDNVVGFPMYRVEKFLCKQPE